MNVWTDRGNDYSDYLDRKKQESAWQNTNYV